MIQQDSVNAYVEQRLNHLGISKAQACEKCGVPEERIDKFLADCDALAYWELLQVLIMFGSTLGDPEELAKVCGIPEEERMS